MTRTPPTISLVAVVKLTTEGVFHGLIYLVDQAGNADPANAAAFTLRADGTPPSAPTLGTVSQNGTDNSFGVDVTQSMVGLRPSPA